MDVVRSMVTTYDWHPEFGGSLEPQSVKAGWSESRGQHPGLVIGVRSGGSLGTEHLPCGTQCYLWIDTVRTE